MRPDEHTQAIDGEEVASLLKGGKDKAPAKEALRNQLPDVYDGKQGRVALDEAWRRMDGNARRPSPCRR